MKKLFLILLFIPMSMVTAQTRMSPQTVALKNGGSFQIRIRTGYEVVPAAEGLKRVRFFARSPDGRMFVTDMYNLTDNKRGAIYILDDFNPRSGKFGKVIPYMTGLRNPNSVQFYTDKAGQDWIYIAETERLTRRKFRRGEISPSDNSPQVVATFPDYGLNYKYGGWHLTRTVAFSPAGKLYVSVGSSCNSCVEKEANRAAILEMNPDGSGSRIIAKGLRNAVGLKWIDGKLWATNQGSDHLGTNRPDETFYAVRAGADYGWPYCHSENGKITADPKLRRRTGCRNVTKPDSIFPARSSALGFDHFDDNADDPAMRSTFLVSLHGSTNKKTGHGYKIVAMKMGRPSQDFIAGFLNRGSVYGRPCDIIRLDANSFLFSDDHTGVVYYVRPKRALY